MQEENILLNEQLSQSTAHNHKSAEPKFLPDYDPDFEAKITPWYLRRQSVIQTMAEISDNYDPSNKEVNVDQGYSEQQDFTNPSLKGLEAECNKEVCAASSSGSFYFGEDSDSQSQPGKPQRMMEETKSAVEYSIPEMMRQYYLQNQMDLAAWNANPVLKKLLPVLLEDQNMSSGILRVPQRRPQELIKKIHLIALRILREDSELMDEGSAHAEMFASKDFKENHRALIVTNLKLYKRICNMSFFKLLSKKLHQETVSDIQKNLVAKFDVTEPAKLEEAFEATIDKDGKRKRTFKKPFTVMENLWSLILYCNEFLFELPGFGANEKRNTIQEIKDHFVNQLQTMGLTIDEAVYPVKRSKGIKDLYFQAFLKLV